VVVDLGATPGGWSQVAQSKVGDSGLVVALDLLEMAPLRGVKFLQGDFCAENTVQMLEEALCGRQIDLVLSDMSPNISGISMSDQARIMDLAEHALEFASQHLKPGGSFLVKVFQGSGFQEYFRLMHGHFRSQLTRKPAASRDRSKELYLLGKGHLGRVAVEAPGSPGATREIQR
jgi:23S rRNA (uridine2552-2'-O)-methyltransferase